jgi:hypothetical protein
LLQKAQSGLVLGIAFKYAVDDSLILCEFTILGEAQQGEIVSDYKAVRYVRSSEKDVKSCIKQRLQETLVAGLLVESDSKQTTGISKQDKRRDDFGTSVLALY